MSANCAHYSTQVGAIDLNRLDKSSSEAVQVKRPCQIICIFLQQIANAIERVQVNAVRAAANQFLAD